jgi:hypothetical protein
MCRLIKRFTYHIILSLTFLFFGSLTFAQNDSTLKIDSVADARMDTADMKADSVPPHSPRVAAFRSAVLPGWGQAYNKKYWKIPIVYGALGTSGGIFIYNITWYRRFRDAYRIVYPKDTARYDEVHRRLQSYVKYEDDEGLRYNRDEFRRNVDYSIVAFILLWGLNVVDATVDAHLKTFDVSPDLSLRVVPGYSEMAKTNGISLVLSIK